MLQNIKTRHERVRRTQDTSVLMEIRKQPSRKNSLKRDHPANCSGQLFQHTVEHLGDPRRPGGRVGVALDIP